MAKHNRLKVLIVRQASGVEFLWQVCYWCYTESGIFSTGIQKNAREKRQGGETRLVAACWCSIYLTVSAESKSHYD